MKKRPNAFHVWNIDRSWQQASDELAAAMEKVFARLREIDPNWSCAEIWFSDDGKTLVSAYLNGPKAGDVSFVDELPALVPVDLFSAESCPVRHIDMYNRRHKPVLDPERTVVYFENCDEGFISAVDAPAPGELNGRGRVPATVYAITTFGSPDEPDRFTRAQIMRDLAKEDAHSGEVVMLRYLPFLRAAGPLDLAGLKAEYEARAVA